MQFSKENQGRTVVSGGGGGEGGSWGEGNPPPFCQVVPF